MAFYQNFAEIPSLLEKDILTYATVQELFRRFEENNKSREERLNSIFGETLEKALEIVEKDKVKFFHVTSGTIGVFQVEGNSHSTYILFPYINYCPCLAFKYQVAGGSSVTCKHVLASIIAKLMGKVELVEITPSQLTDLLSSVACLPSE